MLEDAGGMNLLSGTEATKAAYTAAEEAAKTVWHVAKSCPRRAPEGP
jgi:hypothetical protein